MIPNVPKPQKSNFKDIEGERLGRWLVIAYAGPNNHGATWYCRCKCGTTRVVTAKSILGGSQSCGCLQREKAKETGKTLRARGGNVVAIKHGMSNTPEYRAWNQMIQRCTNPKIRNYPDYGGRGITVCEAWKDSFQAFFDHIGPRPSVDHSLDRVDNNGNYEPGNVRWATDSQQRNNSRHPRFFEYEGEQLSMAEISRRCGISYKTLRERLVTLGWTIDRATTEKPIHHTQTKKASQ